MATFPHEPQDLDPTVMEAHSNGPASGGFPVGAFRLPPMGRATMELSGDGSSGEERGTRKRPRPKASSLALQGRFSGRLAEKADEARLVAECSMLGQLLGEPQPQTLSTLVRSIATGKVRKFLEDNLPAPGTEAQWHSQSALCAAEERERRIGGLQQEVDALKARLWDSGTRLAELETLCSAQQSQLAALAPGESPQSLDPAVIGNAIHAPQAVRFGHAATSSFARLQASGSSLGGMARGSLEAAVSSGISPPMGGPSTLEIARALGRSPGGLTSGRSGSLSLLGTPPGMNSWLPGAGIPDFGGAPYSEMAAQLGGPPHDALAASMPPPWAAAASSRPGSATATVHAAAASVYASMVRQTSQEARGTDTSLGTDDSSARRTISPSAFTSVPGAIVSGALTGALTGMTGGSNGMTTISGASLQEHLASLAAAAPPVLDIGQEIQKADGSSPQPAQPPADLKAAGPHPSSALASEGVSSATAVPAAGAADNDAAAATDGGADAVEEMRVQPVWSAGPKEEESIVGSMALHCNPTGEDAAAAALVNLVSGGGSGGAASSEAEVTNRRPQRHVLKPRSGDDYEEYADSG